MLDQHINQGSLLSSGFKLPHQSERQQSSYRPIKSVQLLLLLFYHVMCNMQCGYAHLVVQCVQCAKQNMQQCSVQLASRQGCMCNVFNAFNVTYTNYTQLHQKVFCCCCCSIMKCVICSADIHIWLCSMCSIQCAVGVKIGVYVPIYTLYFILYTLNFIL